MKKSHKEKITDLLSDGLWHDCRELNNICFRYGARLNELKKEGYEWEKKQIAQGHFMYRKTHQITNDEFMAWVEKRKEEIDEQERVEVGNAPQIALF